MISLPILSLISFAQSMAASIILADFRYGVSPNVVIDSAAKYLELSDIGVMSAKSVAFGAVIASFPAGGGRRLSAAPKVSGEYHGVCGHLVGGHFRRRFCVEHGVL